MALDKAIQLVITSIVTVCVILVISIGCIALVLLYSCCLQRKTKKPTSSSNSQNFLKISYITLVKATDRFSSANLIGVGGSGSVFKGIIDEGERTVAVKVLNLVHHGAYKSFLAEYEALRNIRHRNLMKVLSVCSGFHCKNDDFKALIYEFMSNGSLDKWLHPSPTRTVAVRMDTPRSLNFSQRLNIAIDISMAVDYLHHHCETPIVHCDLKPSNILLNDDMVGHIGDFGLSMAWGTKFGHEVTCTVMVFFCWKCSPEKDPLTTCFTALQTFTTL